MKSRIVVPLSAALLAVGVPRSAQAEWIFPHFDTLGVTARGDTHFQYGVTPIMAPHTSTSFTGDVTSNKPAIRWPTGGSGYTTVALEFPWIEPGAICELPEWVMLTIPLSTPFTPSSPVTLALRSYWEGADGVLVPGDITTRQYGPFLEDMYDHCGPADATCPDADGDGLRDVIATLTLPQGVTVQSLDFVVRWNYSRDRLNQGAGPFKGYFLDRTDTTQDSQVITLQNGGAVIDFSYAFGNGCPPPQHWSSPVMCFEDFGNGDWVTVEFPNAYFDGNGYAIGGVPLDVDPVFGALGCSITPYLGPTGVTNFYPQVSGALLAAYEIDLDGFPVPVGPDNPIRVTIGYHGFSLEQNKEQQLLLYHAPDGLNAVDVTDEYRSNRKGNLDGGYLMSTLRESASPFILAFTGAAVDCASIVVDGFEAPMGATRQLGSKLPLKARLVVDGAPQASADALAALGFDAALVRVYDVTDATHPAVVAERALRDTGAKWSHELDLAAPTFARGRTYEARVLLGSCEIQPTSSRFQIR